MTAKSFRKDLGSPPLRYRTPSPPRDSIEPLSPRQRGIELNELDCKRWTDDSVETPIPDGRTQHAMKFGVSRRHEPQRMGSSRMEAFASIALAADSNLTSPEALQAHGQDWRTFKFDSQTSSGHQSKRALSEKLPSPDWRRIPSRPVTSYIQSTDDRWSEAALLLNFSNEARFDVPRNPIPKQEQSSTAMHHSAHQENFPRPSVRPPFEGENGHNMGLQTTENIDENTLAAEGHLVSSRSTDNPIQEAIIRATEILPSSAPVIDTLEGSFPSYPDLTTNLDIPNEQAGSSQANRTCTVEEAHDSIELAAECTRTREISCNSSYGHEALQKSNVLTSQTTTDSSESLIQDETGMSVNVKEVEVQIPSEEVETASFLYDQSTAEPQVQQASTLHTVPSTTLSEPSGSKGRQPLVPSICAACNFSRNALTIETENDATSWISCDGCRLWFHFACAGFKNEREVRAVDKYRCRKCKPIHGATTYVRKSARAHSAIDYAGLNEGVLKTSDENPEHHYIKPIKDGLIKFHPENFARMRPELVTADYFEKGDGMKEPILIPASLNPRPFAIGTEDEDAESTECTDGNSLHDQSILNDYLSTVVDYETVPNHGQDALDMVIPRNLTVRQVAELYGPDEKVEVIDVKSQNGEDKKWTMRRWVDYYESQGDKVVRNVISLEVSQSRLGRLIRRPKIVRDLDLQDSVWPAELQAKGDFPKVQFYCLMSVADCFTDFHIDFGGSSVFYHILKGKKTFFFIPPHEKHLKKYEEWCKSPAQNWTFLGDQTKECYRVDLSEGDTMLIPAGWIHAVWTPEDSLVIGGNFLTRLHYQMQIRIAHIEKTTGVARKFRYPHFQKLLWYTVLRYLEEDPLPDSVCESLLTGQSFMRERPTHQDFLAWGDFSNPGPENYHARYYSKAEVDGLPELGRYLLRTVRIAMGCSIDEVSVETRNAVRRSIPKVQGEPLDIVKKFGIWFTWKRGNETIPNWAYPDWLPEGGAPELTEKKLSAARQRRMDREAALEAYRVAPDRKSTRRKIQTLDPSIEQSNSSLANAEDQINTDQSTPIGSGKPSAEPNGTLKRKFGSFAQDQPTRLLSMPSKRQKNAINSCSPRPRKPACESCRQRRRACKHRDEAPTPPKASETPVHLENRSSGVAEEIQTLEGSPDTIDQNIAVHERKHPTSLQKAPQQNVNLSRFEDAPDVNSRDAMLPPSDNVMTFQSHFQTYTPHQSAVSSTFDTTNSNPLKASGRSKACKDCRKSKVCNELNKGEKRLLTITYSVAAFTMNMVMKTQSRLKNRRSQDHRLQRNEKPAKRA